MVSIMVLSYHCFQMKRYSSAHLHLHANHLPKRPRGLRTSPKSDDFRCQRERSIVPHHVHYKTVIRMFFTRETSTLTCIFTPVTSQTDLEHCEFSARSCASSFIPPGGKYRQVPTRAMNRGQTNSEYCCKCFQSYARTATPRLEDIKLHPKQCHTGHRTERAILCELVHATGDKISTSTCTLETQRTIPSRTLKSSFTMRGCQ